MKFITEEYLRDLFRKEPFTNYEIKDGERLTPGAREFLKDRDISMFDQRNQCMEKKITNNWKKKKFQSKVRSIEALFLATAQELLSRDVFLAQSVINLGKEFSSVKNTLEESTIIKNLQFKECTGIKEDNLSDDLDDCFEITEFHIQLENGRDTIILHRLRCALRELEPLILELLDSNDSENEFCKHTMGKVNQSINILSQIICSVLGGKKCQRMF